MTTTTQEYNDLKKEALQMGMSQCSIDELEKICGESVGLLSQRMEEWRSIYLEEQLIMDVNSNLQSIADNQRHLSAFDGTLTSWLMNNN